MEDMVGKMCSTQMRAHKHVQSSLRFEVLTVKMTKMIKTFISVLEEHAVSPSRYSPTRLHSITFQKTVLYRVFHEE
jgi:hypothetical protein